MPTRDAVIEKGQGVLVVPLTHEVGQSGEFSRADLVFTGVDHSGPSYEVRVFLNKPDATWETPRTPENGYGGRIVIFGHGGCFGEVGHCEVTAERRPYDRRPPHPLTPQTKLVTVTGVLKKILEGSSEGLLSVTLVPVSEAPLRKDRGPLKESFKFDDVTLRTYR